MRDSREHESGRLRSEDAPPEAVLLFAGVLDGEPWILEVERNNSDTVYGGDLGNFAAIGSGKMLAQALLQAHLRTERDLALGTYFAYRVLDDAIELAAMYPAHPIAMYTIDLDGVAQEVDDAEKRNIATWCEGWREMERDVVGEMLNNGEAGEGDVDIPKPEAD